MHNTGELAALPELPDVPWQAQGGTTFRELQQRAGDLLAKADHRFGGPVRPVELTLFAAHLAELRAKLSALADDELAVERMWETAFAAGERTERERRARRRGSLRPV